MAVQGTVKGDRRTEFDQAVQAAVRQIKMAIRAVPVGSTDPVRLRAAFWGIDRLGDKSYGLAGTVSNQYTVTLRNKDWKCNIFVANAYAIGAAIGWDGRAGVPTNATFLGRLAGRRHPTGANDLANAAHPVRNFPVTGAPSVGDIAAFGSIADYGHSGIYLGGGLLIYAGRYNVKVDTVRENLRGHIGVTYRRYRP
jgi:hypothetical protein